MVKRSEVPFEERHDPKSAFNEHWRGVFKDLVMKDFERSHNTLRIAHGLLKTRDEFSLPLESLYWDVYFAFWSLDKAKSSAIHSFKMAALLDDINTHDRMMIDRLTWAAKIFEESRKLSIRVQHLYGDYRHQQLFGKAPNEPGSLESR